MLVLGNSNQIDGCRRPPYQEPFFDILLLLLQVKAHSYNTDSLKYGLHEGRAEAGLGKGYSTGGGDRGKCMCVCGVGWGWGYPARLP